MSFIDCILRASPGDKITFILHGVETTEEILSLSLSYYLGYPSGLYPVVRQGFLHPKNLKIISIKKKSK